MLMLMPIKSMTSLPPVLEGVIMIGWDGMGYTVGTGMIIIQWAVLVFIAVLAFRTCSRTHDAFQLILCTCKNSDHETNFQD